MAAGLSFSVFERVFILALLLPIAKSVGKECCSEAFRVTSNGTELLRVDTNGTTTCSGALQTPALIVNSTSVFDELRALRETVANLTKQLSNQTAMMNTLMTGCKNDNAVSPDGSLCAFPYGPWYPDIPGTQTTYTQKHGHFYRTGQMVYLAMELAWNATNATGDLVISGLPHMIGGGGARGPVGSVLLENTPLPPNVKYVVVSGVPMTTTVRFYQVTSDGPPQIMQAPSSASIRFSLTYVRT
eukprot:TRINITY_DN12189_c0_g1_i1.p1 TRINITY_DN12189_c0_g1~~TRINITY_DN12189_c0_g1_i1.p1  ORF type:complete len:243 (+),score=31.95 TRINITY_DN12189_c0_g1_i1:94-822(+)